jgi:hypothetical protein
MKYLMVLPMVWVASFSVGKIAYDYGKLVSCLETVDWINNKILKPQSRKPITFGCEVPWFMR